MSQIDEDVDGQDSFEDLSSESIVKFESVAKWLNSVGAGKDISAMDEQIKLIVEFCNFVRFTPDELILKCIRTLKDGTRAISTKGRNQTEEFIKSFVTSRGKTGNEGIIEENKVRGFFVHNGIFMQGRAAIL